MNITYTPLQFELATNRKEEITIRIPKAGGSTTFSCIQSFIYCSGNAMSNAGIITNERFEYIYDVFSKFIPSKFYKIDKLNKRIVLSNRSIIYIYNNLHNVAQLSGLRCQFLVLDRFQIPEGDYIDFIKYLCKPSIRGQRKFIRIHNNYPFTLSEEKQKQWKEFREIMINIKNLTTEFTLSIKTVK